MGGGKRKSGRPGRDVSNRTQRLEKRKSLIRYLERGKKNRKKRGTEKWTKDGRVIVVGGQQRVLAKKKCYSTFNGQKGKT